MHIKCDNYYTSNFIYFISVIFRRDVTSELNSRNPTFLPLKHHQKSSRSHLQSPMTQTYSSQIA